MKKVGFVLLAAAALAIGAGTAQLAYIKDPEPKAPVVSYIKDPEPKAVFLAYIKNPEPKAPVVIG